MKRNWSLAALGAAVALAGAVLAAPAKVDPKDLKTTPSGLKYAILKPGKGDGARKNQPVTVHYTGWLANGTKFDSSRDRNEPLTFVLGVGQVIEGWDEGVLGMKPGEQRQLIIPPDLAYGDEDQGPIPAKSTLTFDVELISLGEDNERPTKVDSKKFKTTPSGLKYAILVEGTGPQARNGKAVTVDYTGWLEKGGKKFDSSVDRGRPFIFTLGEGRVIPGWEEGVEGMKVGEKRQLIIPAALGYGDQGAGKVIPPKATLIFDVKLLRIGN